MHGRWRFQSTRPLRGATYTFVAWQGNAEISIHAPLAGRDPTAAEGLFRPWNFNPRAPCGARQGAIPACTGDGDFNPRAPCGARH